ncbi:DUF2239 family protein [Cupriavidus malaysiensis]|uniref:DUF2239 family protein n=1 Tax=Cupriavidus malaysiensis TaxID=367825 RepID=A0A1D9ICV3_9BURK|nr:DUF2239 family protein [Cupriavidus malaysiensis]AOZ09937.1 hypothetical protein BKK80_30130 [Cupriavidus malaysiensis]
MAYPPSYTAFAGHRLLASGSLASVALAVRQAPEGDPVLIFDDGTGRPIDIDTRGSEAEVRARFAPATDAEAPADAGDDSASSRPKGRGRPKLGVVAREVTLLPRHWEWLASQPGGASVALRKLVDEARRAHGEHDRLRRAQERAYHFMSALAGDLPGFEEAARALFAHDAARFAAQIAGWPADVRDHAARLASGELPAAGPED